MEKENTTIKKEIFKDIFALDVGTRNVVGIVFDYVDEKIIVKEAVSMEHETRAMEDGQIHDISKVARIVEKVKLELESRIGKPIKEVAVAVAGRALVTHKGTAKKDLNIKSEITEEDLLAMEMAAIQNSLTKLDDNNKKIGKEYHCVGFTVSEYKLDGDSIKNPIFQKGTSLEIEILATFLPRIVVDSMFTMAKKVGLEIVNLTLEPIAAISVVIPEDLRKLNLALVDIGAGTSDIAITKEGKIIGYEMVPMAGDEVTERIANEFLLDFAESERVKIDLCDESNLIIKYNDILGMEFELQRDEIISKIDSVTGELGKRIADKILELNEKPTQAIILIGGGSLIPKLREKLAESINLVPARVAVRGTEVIKNFEDKSGVLKTAEFVTPVGIANMAVKGRGFKIISITVNGSSYRVFSFKNTMTVMDAFLSSGIDSKELYSRPGKPLTIKVNGKMEVIKGEQGKLAHIKVNGNVEHLDFEIEDGAEIEIIKQRDGRDAVIKMAEFVEKYANNKVTLKVNGIEKTFVGTILVNDESKDDDFLLSDRDEVNVMADFKVYDVLRSTNEQFEKHVNFELSGNLIKTDIPIYEVKRAGKTLGINDLIASGDEIELIKNEVKDIRISEVIDSFEEEDVEVTVNSKKINFGKIKGKVFKNSKETTLDDIINNGDKIEVRGIEDNLPMVSEIFRFYEPEQLDIEKKGGVLKIEVNGRPAEFITKLKNKDVVKIYHI